jgi:hypothetical protein
MKTSYFKSCTTKQQAKKTFRELAQLNHPDKFPQSEKAEQEKIMVSIIAEYEKVIKILPSEKTDNNQQAEQTEEEIKQAISAEMKEILDNISHMPIDIEIIGTWIWVSGNTFPYKSYLTAYNFSWCPTKKMYQWHKESDKSRYHGKVQDIEKIRFNYGSTKVNNAKREAIQ